MRRLGLLVLAAALFCGQALAGGPAVRRITVPGEGLVRISGAQLDAWGLDGRHLYVYTAGRGTDYLRCAGGIEVYSAPYDNPYAAQRAFLVSDRPLPYPGRSAPASPGKSGRYHLFSPWGRPNHRANGPDWYVETAHVEQDQTYLSGLTCALPGEEHWYYSTFLMPGRSLALTAGLDGPLAPGAVRLKVALRGCSDVTPVEPDHCVEVRFNGQKLGEMLWNGYVRLEQEFELPAGLAAEGPNTVTLSGKAMAGVAFDIVYVDWVEVSYPRRLAAVGDRLSLSVSAPAFRQLSAGGFSGQDVRVLDVTDPCAPLPLSAEVFAQNGAWTTRWLSRYSGERRYLLAGPAGRLTPSSDRRSDPWDARLAGGHRYLVVTHPDHATEAARLAVLRGGRRGRVRVYDVRDVYDAFACGQEIPDAIRELARFHRPKYLCIVGDSSADMRGLLGPPGTGLIPSFLVQGPHFEEASDNLFGCISGNDERPEVAVGRLPARAPAEAAVMVDKVAARLTAVPDGYAGEPAALTIGDHDQAIFEEGTREFTDLLGRPAVEEVLFSSHASTAERRAAIVAGWGRSPRHFVYFGHAATNYLAKGKVLRDADVPLLAAERLPAGAVLACLAGCYNLTSGADSLAERMLKQPGVGACALVAPSGMSAPEGQLLLGRELARLLRADPDLPLGDALVAAKRRLPAAHRDVLRSFNLLGDPALR